MGAKFSSCCVKCFHSDDPQSISVRGDLSESLLPPGVELETFDDSVPKIEQISPLGVYQRSVEHAFRLALSAVTDSSFSLLSDSHGIHVYGKLSSRGYLLRSVWHSPLAKERVIAFVQKYEHRPSWDASLAECRVLAASDELKLTYHRLKKMLTVSPRDFVTACRSFSHGGALVEVATSVESVQCPPLADVVRASIFFGAFFAEGQSDGSATVTTVTEMDFGGSIPSSVMLQMSGRFMPKYVKNLITGLMSDTEIPLSAA